MKSSHIPLPVLQVLASGWLQSLWVVIPILLTDVIYSRGWSLIRRTRPRLFPPLRLASFLAGLAVLWIALDSPLDTFAGILLSAHMVEHVLLTSVVPPLILFGRPLVPLLRGLPTWILKPVIGPLVRFRPLRSAGRFLVSLPVAWLLMNITFLGWHTPAAYNVALRREGWHVAEHLCFLFTSIIFWWPVMEPWPAHAHRQKSAGGDRRWLIVLYLLAADIVNTALSAFLAFCDRPVYSFYLTAPNPFHVQPLADQVLGAAFMWIFGSIVFIVPAVILVGRILAGGRNIQHTQERAATAAP